MSPQLLELLNNSENEYKIYFRKKKNGKLRKITAPSEELKTLQAEYGDFLYEIWKNHFDKSPHITGFTPNKSIKDNAAVHLGKDWILNIDIKDFFPSITEETVRTFLFFHHDHVRKPFKDLSEDNIIKLCCLQGALPQGSPCSPIIANLIASFTIDNGIIHLAKKYGFDYTRYADDITLSANESYNREEIKSFAKEICNLINSTKFLKVNERKINIKHKSQRQMVTGVLVNHEIPRINKKVTNKLRAILHNHKIQDKPLDDKVSGILGYVKQINLQQFLKLTKDFPCRLLTSDSLNLNLPTAQKLLDHLN